MTVLYILIGILICASGYIATRLHMLQQDGDPRLKADLERKDREIGELKNQLTEQKSVMDKKAGEGKQLYAENVQLKAHITALQKELNKYESQQNVREEEKRKELHELKEARNSLNDEKMRLRKEDEERWEREMQERDRMWAEHENSVNALLSELCKKPQIGFTSYDNTNLPEGFDGSLKPDFMIEFLEQYIIFDAKISKSQDLQNYIANTVKSTAKKIKKKQEIYHAIFLVVPTDAISSLKKFSYLEENYTFYIVSPESLEPILASLKRIADYELAEQFDPQDREKVISVLAEFGYHINERNAFDVLMAKKGIDILDEAQKLPTELAKEIATKNVERRIKMPKTSDIKRLAGSTENQREELDQLTVAKAAIETGE